MRQVWKYQLAVGDYVTLDMPKGAEILSFALQRGVPCLWVLVDPAADTEVRKFRLAGTGHPIMEAHLEFIGTIHVSDSALIFHLFEMTKGE